MAESYEENHFEKLEKLIDKTYLEQDISRLVEGLCALGSSSQLILLYGKKFSRFQEIDRKKIIDEICCKGSCKELMK